MPKLDYRTDTKEEADEQTDQRYNPANELYQREKAQAHESIPDYDRNNDGLDGHPITAGDASGESGDLSNGQKDGDTDIEDVKNKEETPWQDNTTIEGKAQKKSKRLPGLIITAVLGFFGLGSASFINMQGLIVPHVTSSSENTFGNISKATPLHWREMWRNRFGNVEACAENPSGFKCKRATVGKNLVQRFEKEGFKLETEKFTDDKGTERFVIVAATFPGPDGKSTGERVTTGAEFLAAYDRSVSNRSFMARVLSPRNMSYLGTKFTDFLRRYGLERDKINITGKDRAQISSSFNKEGGLPEDPAATIEEDTAKVEADLKSKTAEAGGKATNVAGLACSSVDVGEKIITGVKLKRGLPAWKLGFMILKGGDQWRANDITPETASALATFLTEPEASGPNKGKSAMDSPAMKAMLHGDRDTAAAIGNSLLLGNNAALKKVDGMIRGVKSRLGVNLNRGCRAVDNPVIGAALTAAICGAGGGTAGTVVPILGNVVGGVGGVAVCTAANLVTSFVGGLVMGYVGDQILEEVIEYLKEKPPSFDMPATDRGEIVAMAAALTFGGAGLDAGMKFGTKEEVKTFNADVLASNQQYEEVARYDARKTPFDATNQYSFMGQLVSKLGLIKTTSGNPFTSAMSTVGSILSTAPSSVFSTALANDMPSPIKDGTLGLCPDSQLASKNIACTVGGAPFTVQTKGEMTQNEKKNEDYMLSNEYILPDGTPNPEKEYVKFLKYCTTQPDALPGTSAISVSDEDYDWPQSRCQATGDTMISNFRTHLSRDTIAANEDSYNKPAPASGGGAGAPAPVTPEAGNVDGDDYKTEWSKYSGVDGEGQCVDFVKFRLRKHGVLSGPISLGHGKNVVATLGGLGYKVDKTPAVHSVLSISTGGGGFGHTAMVSQVNSDGSIVVEEYNFANETSYGTRTIKVNASTMTFAHTEVDYK